MAVQPAGGDYRSGGGIGLGAPDGAKGGRYFAEDDAGPQRPFAVVVGGGDIATGDEKEEIAAAFADGLGELSSGLGGRRRREQPIEPAVEVGAVLGEVLSLRSVRRWPMPTARCKSLWKPGAKPVSPLSMAYCESRSRWARHSCRSLACPACAA